MTESLRRMTEMQANQAAVNAALLDVLSRLASEKPSLSAADLLEQFAQKQASLSLVNGNLPSYQGEKRPSPKMEIAKAWLREHPEDLAMTGRELEEKRKPNNIKISYVYWNKAKSQA